VYACTHYPGGSIFGQQQQQQSGGLSSGQFSFAANSNKGPTFGASAAITTTTTGNIYTFNFN